MYFVYFELVSISCYKQCQMSDLCTIPTVTIPTVVTFKHQLVVPSKKNIHEEKFKITFKN